MASLKKATLGYLGPPGTFCEEAIERLGSLQIESCLRAECASINAILDGLASGELGFGFVPLRNSIAGDYEQTTAAVKAGSVVTVATVAYPIRLAVGIHPDTVRTAITEIWSKDIAMQQCSRYLDKNFPMATRVAVESTATAMWWIRERGLKCVAAVGSENGLGRYGLKVVDIGVEDLPNNVTTFVLLKQNR